MNETVEQKAPKPPGLIPKHVQNYVILGVATVLIAIIWLTSGGQNRSFKPAPSAQATPDFSRLNQAKLEEYRNQLAAQERLLREQQALLLGQQPTSPHDPTLPLDPTQGKSSSPDPREALKTQLELEQEKKSTNLYFPPTWLFLTGRRARTAPTWRASRVFEDHRQESLVRFDDSIQAGTPASGQPGPLPRLSPILFSASTRRLSSSTAPASTEGSSSSAPAGPRLRQSKAT
jgi:hypothetical protein